MSLVRLEPLKKCSSVGLLVRSNVRWIYWYILTRLNLVMRCLIALLSFATPGTGLNLNLVVGIDSFEVFGKGLVAC